MTDAQGGAATQGDAAPTAQGATDSTAQGAATTPPAGNGAASGSSDQGPSVEQLLRENKQYRDKIKAAEAAEEARKQAALSEEEKVKSRLAALEQQNKDLLEQSRTSALRASVAETATRLGFRNPEVAFRLLDATAIDYKEDGTPRNLERLLKDVLEKDPYLGKPTGAPDFGGGQRGKTPAGGTDMNSWLRREAGH
jgi:hypothetical protein